MQVRGSHLLAFGAGWPPDARFTRQPWDTGRARGARVPRAACVPLAKRGDKAGTGQGAHSTAQPHSLERVAAPSATPSPLPSPSHLLSLLASITGSALGEQRKGSGQSIPPNRR